MSLCYKKEIMLFLAAYDKPEQDRYEKHVTRIAKRWLAIVDTDQHVQGIVADILEEFDDPTPDDYGCAWDDLRTKFTNWAVAEEWI